MQVFGSTRAWIRRPELERKLAHGADPTDSPALGRRAERLVSRRSRKQFAKGVERLVADAYAPPRFTAAVPVPRGPVLRCRSMLVALAATLRSKERVCPRGMALLNELITRGDSVLYVGNDPEALAESLREIREALAWT